MLDAADVLVNGEPILGDRGVKRAGRVFGVGVAVEVPARIDEGVHGVGLAACGASTFRTGNVDKLGHAAERRTTLLGDLDLRGQNDGELVVGHGNQAIELAVNHGDGRCPSSAGGSLPNP